MAWNELPSWHRSFVLSECAYWRCIRIFVNDEALVCRLPTRARHQPRHQRRPELRPRQCYCSPGAVVAGDAYAASRKATCHRARGLVFLHAGSLRSYSLRPELNGCLRVEHHCSGLLHEGAEHTFCDAVLMLRVWRRWFVADAASCEDPSEQRIVVFSTSIVASEPLNAVAPVLNLGFEALERSYASLRALGR